MEVVLVTIAVNALFFYLPAAYGCLPMESGSRHAKATASGPPINLTYDDVVQYSCPHGQYNPMATLTLTSQVRSRPLFLCLP